MKTCLLTLLLCICAIITKAQYVPIPDANFRTYMINSGMTTCFNGTMLDTNCVWLVNNSSVNVNYDNINSLEGIQYFDNLERLECIGNNLVSLPPLPSNLTLLKCQDNDLSSLPTLPAGLATFECYRNQLGTLPAIPPNITQLNVESNVLTSLPALPAGLTYLKCSQNQLTALPALPNGLVELYCNYNNINVLPTLPPSLKILMAGRNNLTTIPSLPYGIVDVNVNGNSLINLGISPMPLSLKTLSLSNNPNITFPALPDSLLTLECNSCSLTTVPTLPPLLIGLSCSFNQIVNLPTLPPRLEGLDCFANQIVNLPALPSSMLTLTCGQNQISQLPSLPPNLFGLDVTNNLFTQLPQMPSSLQVLTCDGNNITALPDLSGTLVSQLNCRYTAITSLPALPDSIAYLLINNNPNLHCLPYVRYIGSLDFQNTPINCVPSYNNVFYESMPDIQTLPLCDPNNQYNCDISWSLAGSIYKEDGDCILTESDSVLNNIKVKLLKDNIVIRESIGGSRGRYSFDINELGSYTVEVDAQDAPLSLTCVSNTYFHNITTTDYHSADNHFAFDCNGGADMGVKSIVTPTGFRPALNTTVNIMAGDLANFLFARCAVGVAGSITAIINGVANYIAPASEALTPSSISGDTVRWIVADFGTTNAGTDFNIVLRTDTFAQIGQQVCLTVRVTSDAVDNDTLNNTYMHCFDIVNSYDPNDKQVYPAGNIDTAQEWLTYTVRFQNTGNAEAINIYLMDTLDSNVDASTFQLLAFSHQPGILINEHIVKFDFPSIYLPDSNSNEPASHGYVQYKVKLNEELPIGTQISNTAYIYFDFNAPVITNTVTNTISEETDTVIIGIKETNAEAFTVSIYPNPASSTVWVVVGEAGCEMKLYNLQGELMKADIMNGTNHSMSIADLPSGIYTIDIAGKSSRLRKKLVKL